MLPAQISRTLSLTFYLYYPSLRAGLLDHILCPHRAIVDVGGRGVMVIVVGNGRGDTSSNPGRDWLHFT